MTTLQSDEEKAAEFFKLELQKLHEEAHPTRQEGEFTIAEYAEANGLTVKAAGSELSNMEKYGKLIKCPNRYIGSNLRVVYKKPTT